MTSDQRPHGTTSESDASEAVPVIEIPDFTLRSPSTEGTSLAPEGDADQRPQAGRTSVMIKTDEDDPTDIRVVIDAPHIRRRDNAIADSLERRESPSDFSSSFIESPQVEELEDSSPTDRPPAASWTPSDFAEPPSVESPQAQTEVIDGTLDTALPTIDDSVRESHDTTLDKNLVIEPVPSPQMTPMPPPPAATEDPVAAVATAESTTDEVAKSGTLVLLFASLVTFGLAMRLWIATTSFGFLDSEESIIVLMAKAFREGDFSAFIWGQNYGGTVEVLLTAALGWVVGTGAVAAKLAPALFLLGSCAVVWLIGRRLFDHATGVIAAALLWAGPLSLLLLSTKAYGNLMAMLFFSLVAFFSIIVHQQRPSALAALAGGLSAGIALWCGPQALALLVPATIWMFATNLRSFRYVSLGAFGILAGLLPFFAGAVKNDFATVRHVTFSWDGTLDRLHGFVTTAFPLLLGTKLPHTTAWLAPVVGILATVLLVGILVIGAVRTYQRRPEWRSALALIGLCLVLSPVVLALLPIELGAPDGHHIVLLWAPLLLLAAACFGRFRVTIATTVMFLGVASMVLLLTNPGSSTALRPGDLSSVVANLEARGADATFADESLAYRLIEASNDKVLATPIARNRNLALSGDGSTIPGITNYVTREGSLRDQAFSLYVEERHLVHQRDVVGDFAVYQVAATLELPDLRSYLQGLLE